MDVPICDASDCGRTVLPQWEHRVNELFARRDRDVLPSSKSIELLKIRQAICYHRRVLPSDPSRRSRAGAKADLEILPQLSSIAATHPGLGLLMIFGSRARGDAHPASDWDFGYLAGADFDPDALLAQLTAILSVDHLDLVDLHRASAQLRYRAAAVGRVVYASDRGIFDRFWMDAVSFWCDAAPVLRAGYAAILDRLDG